MAQDTKLQLLLEARNNASAKLKEVQNDIGKLDSAAATASKGFSGLASALALGGVAALAKGAGSVVYEMAQLAARSYEVENAFNRLASSAGQSASGMLNQLKAASSGTISEYNLMLSANKAMMLGVAKNGEEMGRLLEIARSRGQAMGATTEQAFNDIVTGLGRGSALILDNLGIVVSLDEAYQAYAGTLGKVAGELTEAEKKQALVNDAIRQASTSSAKPLVNEFERMNAEMDNLKVAMGETFGPQVVAGARAIANAINSMRDPDVGISMYGGLSANEIRAMQDNGARQRSEAMEGRIAAEERAYRQLYAAIEGTVAAEKALADERSRNWQDAMARIKQQTQGMVFDLYPTHGDEALQMADELAAKYQGLYASLSSTMAPWMKDGIIAAAIKQDTAAMISAGPAWNRYISNLDTMIAENTEARAGLSTLAEWLGITGTAASGAGLQLKSLAGTAAAAALGISQAGSAVKQAGLDSLVGAQNIATARSIIDGISATTKLKRGWEEVREEFGRWNADLGQGAKAGAVLQQVAYMSYPAAQGIGSISSAMQSLNQQFETLKAKSQGVLSGALSLDGITIPTGPRQDAINENARRLAAIANQGLMGQSWWDEFANEVPDIAKMLTESGDPKAAAQQLMRDFQDGLMPQLLDKDMAKERVRRMILGDQTMATMANDIAQELSREMGISLSAAQMATGGALGLSASSTGAQFMDGGAEGSKFADAFSVAISDKYGMFDSSGRNAANHWGVAFTQEITANVPITLITVLATLVTPEVLKRLKQDESRSGAR